MQVVNFVNNSNSDISDFFDYFKEAYKTGVLHEDISDLFTIKILKSFNPDGTDRMIIDAS